MAAEAYVSKNPDELGYVNWEIEENKTWEHAG